MQDGEGVAREQFNLFEKGLELLANYILNTDQQCGMVAKKVKAILG